jgi:hypothetical protein
VYAEFEARAVPEVKSSTSARTAPELPWTIAAPSCVLPAGVAENCTFLAPRFDEIGLAFFETGPCLAYTRQDLPDELAGLPVSWHVHLPLDLPWTQDGTGGAERVAGVILALARKVEHLSPGAFVLHPPQSPKALARLAELLEAGGLEPERLLVENIQGRDLEDLWPAICGSGLGVCLDLGHLLAHGQEDFLALPGLSARLAMVHLNAPDPRKPARHAALSLLDGHGQGIMREMLALLDPSGVVMLELFGEAALAESLRVLRGRTGTAGGEKAA